MHHWVKFCVNPYKRDFALQPRKVGKKLVQGYGGMHHWVKYCVNWCMESEVIARTSSVTDRRTPSISMYSLWISHGIQW